MSMIIRLTKRKSEILHTNYHKKNTSGLSNYVGVTYVNRTQHQRDESAINRHSSVTMQRHCHVLEMKLILVIILIQTDKPYLKMPDRSKMYTILLVRFIQQGLPEIITRMIK